METQIRVETRTQRQIRARGAGLSPVPVSGVPDRSSVLRGINELGVNFNKNSARVHVVPALHVKEEGVSPLKSVAGRLATTKTYLLVTRGLWWPAPGRIDRRRRWDCVHGPVWVQRIGGNRVGDLLLETAEDTSAVSDGPLGAPGSWAGEAPLCQHCPATARAGDTRDWEWDMTPPAASLGRALGRGGGAGSRQLRPSRGVVAA